ncbi:MAG: response regulator transcription factor [Actinomycetota bacterium]
MTSPAPRVLVVDDEENISFLVGSALKLEGCDVRTADTGSRAVDEAARFDPHVVVLDVMLPDMDGFEVMRQLRNGGCDAPVLFLTARRDTADRVRGLTAGGDDYIVKPFALEEVVARVQVALRRRGSNVAVSRHQVHDLVLDDTAHRVWRGDAEVLLSATEYKLLRLLITNAGRVVSRAQILDHVWQYDFDGESAIIESFISNLRKKADASEPKLIHTVRGMGYILREPSPPRGDE